MKTLPLLTALLSFLLPGKAPALVLFDTIDNPIGSFSGTNSYQRKAAQHFTTGGAVVVLQEYSARFDAWRHGPLKFSIVAGGTSHPDGPEVAVIYEGESTGLTITAGILTISDIDVTLQPATDYWLVLTNTYLGPSTLAGGFDFLGCRSGWAVDRGRDDGRRWNHLQRNRDDPGRPSGRAGHRSVVQGRDAVAVAVKHEFRL